MSTVDEMRRITAIANITMDWIELQSRGRETAILHIEPLRVIGHKVLVGKGGEYALVNELGSVPTNNKRNCEV